MTFYYWNPEKQSLLDLDGVRKEYPTASIPEGGDIGVFNYFPVEETQPPEFDPLSQVLSWSIDIESTATGPKFKRKYAVGNLPEKIAKENFEAHCEKLKKDFEEILETNLDAFATQKGYKNLDRAIGYISSSVKEFKEDAITCVALRDNSFSALYSVFDKVSAKKLSMPKSFSEIEKYLPELKWK